MSNIIITNNLLEEFLICKKGIIQKPKKTFKVVDEHRVNTFTAQSVDASSIWDFDIYLRQSEQFEENFSIILKISNSPVGEITLLRCNGPHGTTRKGGYHFDHHASCHIHKITYEDIKNDKFNKPSLDSEANEYFDFESGILYFCKICNILDYEKHFSYIKQIEFDEMSGE